VIFGTGCGSQVPPEPDSSTSRSDKTGTNRSGNTPVGDTPGYVHHANASKFHLGANTSLTSDGYLERTVGDEGAFTLEPIKGVSLAILAAKAPVAQRPPLTTDGDAHNAAVRAYFVTAGLPESQIDSVSVHAHMQAGGLITAGFPESKLVKFTSVISRIVGGVPVSDSSAYASFNADGETTSEFLYWPQIPAATLADAKALQERISDPDQLASLLAQAGLQASALGGRVVIHHTRHTQLPPLEFWATYDVMVGKSEIHVDSNGKVNQLGAHAQPGTVVQSTKAGAP
jgi:hypothetical protein